MVNVDGSMLLTMWCMLVVMVNEDDDDDDEV
jgi:hypothetical protein